MRCTQCGAEAPKWMGQCPACGAWGSVSDATPADGAVALGEVPADGAAAATTGIAELDRVLGGGLVAGSVTLLGGEPGVGKSTLVLQAAAAMATPGADGRARRVLLVAAEESPEQVRLRAERLGTLPDELLVVAECSVPHLLAHADALAPDVLVVDSIQTVHDPDAPGVPGSVTQVRDS